MPIKKTVKKKAKKPAPLKPKSLKIKPIGIVTHYYGGLGVAIVKFSKPTKVGASVNFKGATTDFTEVIKSMQFDHKEIKTAPKGKQVGIKVKGKVRDGDEVFPVA